MKKFFNSRRFLSHLTFLTFSFILAALAGPGPGGSDPQSGPPGDDQWQAVSGSHSISIACDGTITNIPISTGVLYKVQMEGGAIDHGFYPPPSSHYTWNSDCCDTDCVTVKTPEQTSQWPKSNTGINCFQDIQDAVAAWTGTRVVVTNNIQTNLQLYFDDPAYEDNRGSCRVSLHTCDIKLESLISTDSANSTNEVTLTPESTNKLFICYITDIEDNSLTKFTLEAFSDQQTEDGSSLWPDTNYPSWNLVLPDDTENNLSSWDGIDKPEEYTASSIGTYSFTADCYNTITSVIEVFKIDILTLQDDNSESNQAQDDGIEETDPEYLFLCQDKDGKAKIKIDLSWISSEIAREDIGGRLFWEIRDRETDELSQNFDQNEGNFSAEEATVEWAVPAEEDDFSREFTLKAWCDCDGDGEHASPEPLREVSFTIADFYSLEVSPIGDIDNKITADNENPAPSNTLYVCEGSNGVGQVMIQGLFQPDDIDNIGQHTLWMIEQNGNITQDGTFEDLFSNVDIDASAGRLFTVKAGYDLNRDGELSEGEEEFVIGGVIYKVNMSPGDGFGFQSPPRPLHCIEIDDKLYFPWGGGDIIPLTFHVWYVSLEDMEGHDPDSLSFSWDINNGAMIMGEGQINSYIQSNPLLKQMLELFQIDPTLDGIFAFLGILLPQPENGELALAVYSQPGLHTVLVTPTVEGKNVRMEKNECTIIKVTIIDAEGSGGAKYEMATLPDRQDSNKWSAKIEGIKDVDATIKYERGGVKTIIPWAGTPGQVRFAGNNLNVEIALYDGPSTTPVMMQEDTLLKISAVQQGDKIIIEDSLSGSYDCLAVVKNFSWNDLQRLGSSNFAMSSEFAGLPAQIKVNILNTIKFCLDPRDMSAQATQREVLEIALSGTGLCTLNVPSSRGVGFFPDDMGHFHLAASAILPDGVSTALNDLETESANQENALGIDYGTGCEEESDRAKFVAHDVAVTDELKALLTQGCGTANPFMVYHTYELVNQTSYIGGLMKPGDPIRNIKTAFESVPQLFAPPDPDNAGSWRTMPNTYDIVEISFMVNKNGKVVLFYSAGFWSTHGKSLLIRDALSE